MAKKEIKDYGWGKIQQREEVEIEDSKINEMLDINLYIENKIIGRYITNILFLTFIEMITLLAIFVCSTMLYGSIYSNLHGVDFTKISIFVVWILHNGMNIHFFFITMLIFTILNKQIHPTLKGIKIGCIISTYYFIFSEAMAVLNEITQKAIIA